MNKNCVTYHFNFILDPKKDLTYDETLERNVAHTQTKIAEISQDVDQEIDDLDEKLDKVLEKNEKDFLTAYRFHMLKV